MKKKLETDSPSLDTLPEFAPAEAAPTLAAAPGKPQVYDSMPTPAALLVPDGELRTIEFWRDELGTPAWLYAGTKLGKAWPLQKELSRSDYEAAVKWAATVASR